MWYEKIRDFIFWPYHPALLLNERSSRQQTNTFVQNVKLFL